MSGRLWIPVIFLVQVLIPDQSMGQAYTKLAPSDPVVHVVNGKGAEIIYFSKASASAMPLKIIATEASGKVNSIPASDITIGNPVLIETNVFSVPIAVTTSQFVDPGTPYEGTLLFFAPDKTGTPTTFKFKIQDDATVSFDTTPSTMAVAVGGSLNPHQRIRVRNTGKATITSLQITSSVFVDNVNHHTLQMPFSDRTANIPPGQASDVDFDLPEPSYAGTYAGTLIIVGNHVVEKNLSLTLQSRGPLANYRFFPFLLFISVIVLGFTVSSVLDAWFGSGGLARAQAFISLKNSENTFEQQLENLASWRATVPDIKPPIEVPKAVVWIAQALHELRASSSTYPDRPIAEITADADSFATRAAAANSLWTALQTATIQWKNAPERLREVSATLDAVALPQSTADLGRYRSGLRDVLVSSATQITPHAAAVAQPVTAQDGSILKRLRAKIRRMTALYQVIVWTVVFVTGYLSFFAGHTAFGTLADYFTVFMWALGLTSTGTQIITRIHKP